MILRHLAAHKQKPSEESTYKLSITETELQSRKATKA
uniref:Uncharacterized protein n=1 Tax=Rhizophora mucronata TaxID=61149 RepID=A0A2P2QTQ1_RHIMU